MTNRSDDISAATMLSAVDTIGKSISFPEIQQDDGKLSARADSPLTNIQADRDMIVNVTMEYPFDFANVMFGYMMPFVLVVTLVTNTLVVMVLAQRHMRTPTNIVLFTMAIVDLMTLLSPSPWYFYIYTLGYYDKFLYPPIACYTHHIMTDTIPVFFHTSSIWLALLLASQRYIYVCHPTLARTCYFTFRILFVFIIPSVALITLNYLLFRALKRAENKRTELLRTRFKLTGGNHGSVGAIDLRNQSFTVNHINGQELQTDLVNDDLTSIVGNDYTNQIKPFDRSPKRLDARRVRSNCTLDIDSIARTPYNRGLYETKQSTEPNVELIPTIETLTGVSENRFGGDSQLNKIKPAKLGDGDKLTNRLCNTETSDICSESTCCVSENRAPSKSHSDLANGSGSVDGEARFCTIAGLTCAECSCFGNNDELICYRCSGAASDGATDDTNKPKQEEVSRTSSLPGGATSNLTRDEVSSYSAMKETSSYSFVGHDQSLEPIISGSMPSTCIDKMAVDREENLSLQNSKSTRFDARFNQNERCELSKSHSIDSRLVCRCFSSHTQDIAVKRMRLARQSHKNCADCCSYPSNSKTINNSCGSSGKSSKCMISCSTSDPCINCNNSNCSSKRDVSASDTTDQTLLVRSTIATSKSEEYDNQGKCSSHLSTKLFGVSDTEASFCANQTATTTTTTTTTATTTTTTLLSHNANSIGSLLQVQNFISNKRQGSQKARIKSPSFASSVGRGSRGTLSGSINPMPIIVSNNMLPSSSTRTMDSNRTTLMLIVVVTVFLMVEVPVALVTIVHVVLNTFDVFRDVDFGSSLSYIKLFTNFLIMISYSVNFTIYCSMSKKFRETFRDLFLCGDKAKSRRAQRSLYQQSQCEPRTQINNQNAHSGNNLTIGQQAQIQKDFASTCTGFNNHKTSNACNIGPRYPHYRKAVSQQPECEL